MIVTLVALAIAFSGISPVTPRAEAGSEPREVKDSYVPVLTEDGVPDDLVVYVASNPVNLNLPRMASAGRRRGPKPKPGGPGFGPHIGVGGRGWSFWWGVRPEWPPPWWQWPPPWWPSPPPWWVLPPPWWHSPPCGRWIVGY